MLPNFTPPAHRSKAGWRALRRARPLLLLPMLLTALGCAGPAYYAQAVSGQLRLMSERRDIESLIEDPAADRDLVRRLQRVQELRQFAANRLDLPAEGNYTRFVRTGRDAVTWNVVVAPEFSLEPRHWCFIVAGCVPYRGYFHEDAARRFAARMARRGLDVVVSPAAAYSTLGWFDDPVLDTMLRDGDEQLAGLLFHELAHRKLYVAGDTAFNEAYASFVEETGTRIWMESTGRTGLLEDWLRREQASEEFDALLQATRDQLERLYASDEPENRKRERKAELFAGLHADYEWQVAHTWGGHDYFGGWIASSLNNAGLALLRSYRGGICAFSDLYRAAGGNMARFHALARQQAALPEDERKAWLAQPCGVVAPAGDL